MTGSARVEGGAQNAHVECGLLHREDGTERGLAASRPRIAMDDNEPRAEGRISPPLRAMGAVSDGCARIPWARQHRWPARTPIRTRDDLGHLVSPAQRDIDAGVLSVARFVPRSDARIVHRYRLAA
jgi:hypothetical protein